MPRDDHSVFISYRRDSGAEIARLLQAFLEQHGFRVFLDVDELDAGHFDAQLLRQIEQCDSFLMICSPGCLDRCANPDDWVRREIAQAIRCRRQIIPIALPGFAWPSRSSLPGEIAEFTQHNAFEYSHAHWRQASHRLLQMLNARGAGGGHAPSEGAASGRDATSAHEAELSVGDRLAVHRAREYERTLERTPGPERARVIAEALTATKVLPESEAARREVVCLRASLGLELGDASELPQLLVDLMDSRVFAAPTDRQLALIVKLERTLATGAAARKANAEPPPPPSAPQPPTAGASLSGHDWNDPAAPPPRPERRDVAEVETGTDRRSGEPITDRAQPLPPRSIANILGWVMFLSGLIGGPASIALAVANSDDRASAEPIAVIGSIGGLLLDLLGTILIGATSRGRRDRWWLLGIWLTYLLILVIVYKVAVPSAATPRMG